MKSQEDKQIKNILYTFLIDNDIIDNFRYNLINYNNNNFKSITGYCNTFSIDNIYNLINNAFNWNKDKSINWYKINSKWITYIKSININNNNNINNLSKSDIPIDEILFLLNECKLELLTLYKLKYNSIEDCNPLLLINNLYQKYNIT